MKRRTDRVLVVCVLVAALVVPAVALGVLATGVVDRAKPDPAPGIAAAGRDRAGAALGLAPPRGAGEREPGAPASPAGSVRPAGSPAKVRSFVRMVDLKVSGSSDGDYRHVTETARITLSPSFAVTASGTRQTMADGRLSTVTHRTVLSGRKLSVFDGRKWRRTQLTKGQYDRLRALSDPARAVRTLRAVPGAACSGRDRFGSTRCAARTTLGSVLGLLPADLTASVRGSLPGSAGVRADVWADRADRASWVGMATTAPGVRLEGSLTFRDYR
ncbi:hypothetical protein ACFVH6_10065 [Spirillospora sp. NPDC127200]